MPYYMLQATYSPQAWSGMVKSPQNRLDAVRPVVEKLGWKKGWDWGDPPTFGMVSSGECEIFLCQGGQGGRGRSPVGGLPTAWPSVGTEPSRITVSPCCT